MCGVMGIACSSFSSIYVHEKTAHIQGFKIDLLVLQDKSSPKVILCGMFFVMKVMRCGVLTISVQSFMTTIVS